MYDLGHRIKAIRKERGLTQKGLAQKINKSTSAVSSYELDRQVPPFDVVITICQALNTSLNYLAGINPDSELSLRGLEEDQAQLVLALVRELQNKNTQKELTVQQAALLGEIVRMLTRFD